MNEWPKAAFGHLQYRQSNGQAKTPRPGASWIKIEHAANSLDPGPMRVAGNDRVNSAGYRVQPQFMDIVQDVDRAPAEPYHLGVGITFRPVVGIDIPSDCNHPADRYRRRGRYAPPRPGVAQPLDVGARGCPK